MTARFFLIVIPLWFGLSLIAAAGWGLGGMLLRRYHRRRGRREYEYQKFEAELEAACKR